MYPAGRFNKKARLNSPAIRAKFSMFYYKHFLKDFLHEISSFKTFTPEV